MSSIADGPDLSSTTALVIDDHPDSVHLLFAVLEPFGARVLAARSVQEAKDMLTAVTPDVVIADLALPGEDGIEFIRWLRSRAPAEGGTIPAIAVTFFYDRFGVREARDAGYNLFFPKPIDPMEIVHAVAALVTQRGSS